MPALLILLAIVILVLNIFLFAMITTYERFIRIKRLKKNLTNFSPVQLNSRLDRYEKTIKSSTHKDKLNDDIKETTLVEYKAIERQIKKVETFMTPIKAFNFLKFNSEYKSLIESISEYEISYLENRFKLFDLTSDIEIEKAIIESLKKRLGKVREKTNNSPLMEIRENKKINNKLVRISAGLKKLEDMTDEQIKHLGPDFIDLVVKSDKDIKSLASELDFMNFHIKHLEEELKTPMMQIVDIYKDNKAILRMLDDNIKQMVKNINALKKIIREDIPELKIKKVNENVMRLDEEVSNLNLLIRSNIDYAKFNSENVEVPTKLLKFIRENNALFISEIKRHNIPDEKNRILQITEALRNFENSLHKYEKEKLAKINVHSPQGVSVLVLDIIYKYQEYVKTVGENIKDISAVNDATNRINAEIGSMNTLLLQAELNINSLRGTLREKYEVQKDSLQKKVDLLWKKFKTNTEEVEEKTFTSISNFKKKLEALVSETRGAAFELFFTEQLILFLNKYNGSNVKFDEMLQSVEESYNQEKYSEALRKAKEIVEIYGIK